MATQAQYQAVSTTRISDFVYGDWESAQLGRLVPRPNGSGYAGCCPSSVWDYLCKRYGYVVQSGNAEKFITILKNLGWIERPAEDACPGCVLVRKGKDAGNDNEVTHVMIGRGYYGEGLGICDQACTKFTNGKHSAHRPLQIRKGVSLEGFVAMLHPDMVKALEERRKPATTPEPTPTPTPTPTVEIKVGDSVIVNGVGNGSSDGSSKKNTAYYKNRRMRVLKIANGRYACNQYDKNSGVTGWWKKEQVAKV